MVNNSLVYQYSSSTEAVIQRANEGIQRSIGVNDSQGQEEERAIKINPAMKTHCKLQIEFL